MENDEHKKLTKQEAIDELRREADELDSKVGSIKDYAANAHKAKIRRNVADRLEQELKDEEES